MLHLLEGGHTSDVINCQYYLGILVVYLGYRPISFLPSGVPNFEGHSISVFQLMNLLVIDSTQRRLDGVQIGTLEDVTVYDTGLTDTRVAHDDYLQFLTLHDMR